MKQAQHLRRYLTSLLLLAVTTLTWAYSFAVDGIYYSKNSDGTSVTVTYKTSSDRGYSGSVVIPSTVTYDGKTYSVTSIGSRAFSNCTSLTSVTIPGSVTSIDSWAFEYCSGLKSVTIPNSVTTIGSGAFYGCSGLTSVTIPNSVTSIGSSAFKNCSGLTSVTIPNSVTSIGSDAFEDCTGLTKAKFASIESLCKIKFSNYYSNPLYYAKHLYINGKEVTDVVIPNSITSINAYTFYNCTGLTSVTIPESVTSIGSMAFLYCSGLKSVTINSNAIVSKTYTSSSNILSSSNIGTIFGSQVKEYVLGDNITTIGDYAFQNCSGLTSVTIGSGVTSIGSVAFEKCTGLTKAKFASIESLCKIKFSNYESNPLYYAKHLYINGQEVTDVVIPNSITSINAYTFSGCSSLTSVTIPNSVTGIGYRAFSGCSSLTSVTIGSGVTSINDYAFENTKPTKVIWLTNTPPSGYKKVAGTVNYVANNQHVLLSNTKVYPFLSSMFEVDGVKYVPVIPSERTCDAIDCSYSNEAENIVIGKTVSFKGIDMTVRSINQYTCYQNPYIKNIDLSTNCAVSDASFYGCTALTTATLGKNITGIGDYAFKGCSSLQDIIIPDAVTSLGSYAFSGCSSLGDVHIGSGVTSIGAYAFSDCKALPAIEIPGSVTSIGNYTFSGCTSLKTVIMDGQESVLALGSNGSSPLFSSCPLDSVYIDRPVTYHAYSSYGYSPFYRNTSLRSIHITDKLTKISDNEFYGCTNLKNVRIGNGVTKIGNWAFSGCSSLDYFSFGSGVKEIGQEAFSDCTAMTRLISLAPTPPVCGTQALDDINKWSCTLSVPSGHTAGYQSAEQWKEFFFISDDAESTGIGGIRTDSSDQPSGEPAIYDLNGRRMQHKPAHGFYIQGGKKYFVK